MSTAPPPPKRVRTYDEETFFGLTRPEYEAGVSVLTLLSSGADRIDERFEHGVLRFFTMREARELRLVCRELADNVSLTPWDDLETRIGRKDVPIRRCLDCWRESMPFALAANVSSASDLVDADFVRLRGLVSLDISRGGYPKAAITDLAFAHLVGVRKLIMRFCNQSTITDAALANLRGVEELDMLRCDQGGITLKNIMLQTRGVRTLRLDASKHDLSRAIRRKDVPACLRIISGHDVDNAGDGGACSVQRDYSSLLIASEGFDHERSTPLLMAVGGGSPLLQVIERLLECGVNVDTRGGRNDSTPLLVAAGTGCVDVALLLLDRGAERDARNDRFQTPLSVAIVCKNERMEAALRARGARW